MRHFAAVFLLSLCCYPNLFADPLERGMSVEQARILLGREVSAMEMGDRQILNFEGDKQLEFRAGQLVKEDGMLLGGGALDETLRSTPQESRPTSIFVSEPLEEEPELRVSGSVGGSVIESDRAIEADFASRFGSLGEAELPGDPEESDWTSGGASSAMVGIAIGFGLELVINLVVLAIAFHISGFHIFKGQLIVLSLAVALSGAILDFFLAGGLLDPARSLAGFLVLLFLIKPLTDVRSWVTAIKIAIIARIVAFVLFWLLTMAVLTGLSI